MFSKLIGNDNAKRSLKRLLVNGRVPNSLLFAGDEGVGKRQFALQVAKALVCKEPTDNEACGVCAACRRADVFVFPKSDKGDDFEQVFFSEHPDVGTVIPFKRNLRVNAIRDLEREANFRPYEAEARFFIIDDAHKMNDAAANALLKTLEEPPATSYIFLITSRPDSLLPTIRSRCQLMRFAPVATDEIERFLIDDRAFTHDEARLAARLARGSVGRAVSIDVAKFKANRERMMGVLRNAVETGDRAALLRISEELNDAKNKENFEENLDILESLIHDVWTLRMSGEDSRIVNTDLANDLSRIAENAVGLDLASWLGGIETMRENFAVNINRKIAADALFVTMAGA
ncbi:MAG TPA: DNA polymerase III subunit delta' [Pyrinomonadaceae bacterium]|nr:DNA polymerase III subunit delta' [Pyrinomonadaceae bacterium]